MSLPDPSETTEQHMFGIGQAEANRIIESSTPADLPRELEVAQFMWDNAGDRPWIDMDMLRGYRDTLAEYLNRGNDV